ncbi:MAG: TetR family transcriptional regulator [Planctomycetia bacterium]|jgi:TetR/AcrR family transcriptional regulator
MSIETKPAKRNRKQQLLEAAIAAFSQLGPKATVDEICANAEINKRMVYHYFESKAGLYKAALTSVYNKLQALEIELATMMLSPKEMLRQLIGQYYDFLHENPEFVRMLSFENLDNAKTVRELHLEGNKTPIVEALELTLEKGCNEGHFRKCVDTKELLVSIFGLCFFYFSNHQTLQKLLNLEPINRSALQRRKKHVVDLILEGISV